MNRPVPQSVDEYLAQLREALRGEDPAVIQDALYDAEEYLRGELGQHPGRPESAVLAEIASTYGAPEEVAEAYRNTERTVRAATRPHRPPARHSLAGRFFGVYGDSRAWTALFYLLLSMVTGLVYFTVAVTGLSLSAGLAVLVFGIPFFLLFIGFTRVLSLVEGRIVEGLLGVRMPRRPARAPTGTLANRIAEMLRDRRTWTTLVYLVAMLPLGICYFALAVIGLSLSLALIAAPLAPLLRLTGVDVTGIDINGWTLPGPLTPLLSVLGILMLTALLQLARGLGTAHGHVARALLLSREDA
jgi:uncharacterized membrane protein